MSIQLYLRDGPDAPEFVVADLDVVHGVHCLECDEYAEEAADVPLYECGECNTKFTRDNSATGSNHQCPDCQKFGTKVADSACVFCEASEVEDVEFVEIDGDIVLVEDVADHIAGMLSS